MSCKHDPLIEAIVIWSQAYPLGVFPEPPPGEHGSVDTCSARMGRHVIEALMAYIPVDDLERYGMTTTLPRLPIPRDVAF